jgi:hypothetical protein
MLFTILPDEQVGALLAEIGEFKKGLIERAKRRGGIKAFVLPVEQMV